MCTDGQCAERCSHHCTSVYLHNHKSNHYYRHGLYSKCPLHPCGNHESHQYKDGRLVPWLERVWAGLWVCVYQLSAPVLVLELAKW